MRTPVRTVPPEVERWMSRVRWMRALDAAVAVLAVWPFAALTLETTATGAAVVAGMLVGAAAFVPLLRVRWRPASAPISLSVSSALRPGDVAWCVFPGRVEHVIVTARRRWRLVVARPGRESAEGLEIRRTRVLVVRA